VKIRSRVPIIAGSLLGIVGIISLAVGMTLNQKVSATVPGINQLVSQSTGGTLANASSSLTDHAISGNGRYVVFTSAATNLTSEAVGGVFLRDTVNNTTALVDLTDTGLPASGSKAVISYDGRYVAFESNAANVVAGVTTTGPHVYVRDTLANTTRIADKNAAGTVATSASSPDINADGRYVTFLTNDRALTGVPTNISAQNEVVIKDMLGASGDTRIVSGTSANPALTMQSPGTVDGAIDCSGRVVSFLSNASNLGRPFNRGNADYDLFSYTIDWSSNRKTVATRSISPLTVYTLGKQRPSCDGNTIVYTNESGYAQRYNRLTEAFDFINKNSSGTTTNMASTNGTSVTPSGDGRYVAFTDKGTNMDSSHPQTYKSTGFDVFVRDTVTGTTSLVSFTALGNHSGRANSPNISGNATAIAYTYTTNTSDPNSELISGVNTGQTDIYLSKTGY
jgi:hypothetical protein